MQKSSKVDIKKKEFFSESVIKTFYGSKFLVSETCSNKFIIVKLAGDQRFMVQEISLKIFEQIVTLAYLKEQLTEMYCRKSYS